MNKIHQVIWNKSSGQWVVTSELGSKRKKTKSSLGAALTMSVASLFSMGAEAVEFTEEVRATAGQTVTLNPDDSVIISYPDLPGQISKTGITADGVDAVVNINGSSVDVSGLHTEGIVAKNGGTANVNDVNISADNISLYSYGGTLNITNGSIITRQLDSIGGGSVYGENATINVSGSSIEFDGWQQLGIAGVNSKMNISDVNITSLYSYANSGINALYNSNVTVDNAKIIIEGDFSQGVAAEDQSFVRMSNSSIQLAGSDAIGLFVDGSNMSIDNTNIDVMGMLSQGAFLRNSELALKGVQINAEGDYAKGIWATDQSHVIVNDSVIAASGNDARGIVLGAYSAQAGYDNGDVTLNLQNSKVSSELSDAISQVAVGTKQIYLTNSELVAHNGSALAGDGQADMTMIADKSVIDGDITIDNSASGNGLTDITLKNDSLLKGAVSNVARLTMNDSLWLMSADSSVGAFTVNNAGVTFNTPSSGGFKTLTLDSLSGNGGIFTLNTMLNEGGDNTQSDKLHITGDASGDHTLMINNAGGLGALTVGDGIPVVIIDGSASGSFTQGNLVSAGAYQYLLYQGGSTDINDWYLRSSLELTPETPAEEEPETPTENPANPAETPEAPAVNPVTPVKSFVLYRPEVAGYMAAPHLNEQYGFDAVGTRHERTGDRVSHAEDGSWGRISGQHQENESGRFTYKTDTWFAQLGMDLYQHENDVGDKSNAGVMMTLGHQSTDTRDEVRKLSPLMSANTGNIDSNMYSIGGYYTMETQDHAYFDLVTQGTLYRNKYSSDHDASQKGYGVVLSAEGGKAFATGNGWDLEPQAQVMYQYLNLNSFRDDISSVSGATSNSARVRGGLRIAKNAEGVKPWVQMDVIHTLTDSPTVRIGETSMKPEFTETWWQMGTGVSVKLNDNTDLYADVKYMKDFSADVDGYSGRVGVKVSF